MEKSVQIRLKNHMTIVSFEDKKNFVDLWDAAGQKQARRPAG